MLSELETAVLDCDLPQYGLKRGDRGTIVLVHDSGAAYEVEFIAADGETIAVTTLAASQLQPHGE
jgi:hypothetical protein